MTKEKLPTLKDLENHKWDTSDYVVLSTSIRLVDTSKYDVIPKSHGCSCGRGSK